jgi:A/G-specific adenine glycosylase
MAAESPVAAVARDADTDRARHARIVAALSRWGEAERRDLPWRATRDAWAVLVSEAMLQQTGVTRVLGRYDAFLAAFPDPATTAAAPLAAIVEAWAGLGYYRRARALHASAVAIVERHDGRVPDTLAELIALPGVGPYTARAVLAFAHEHDHGIVDTNAARILARAVVGARLTAARAQAIADALVPRGGAWAWNQAMLDLGATVCVARAPRCEACPLVADCAWRTSGDPANDPAIGSAGTTARQSRFEGSDRQGRGRLIAAMTAGPIRADDVAALAGWPTDPQRADRVLATLIADGLVEHVGHLLRLPR